ncbi:hypothetical protein [Polymorphobacter megasporae]|uniref:hypothetical protein n=1 Tax=Glacieibacterium megasporae TaxID=2835787 RepID=UPI001C1E122E|nr:hypothetical protein [Polymorphobacter megasporae]UAJ10626.1 hypothetical protein KTC28_02395 [Polymorphobacter megasporae]
MVLTSGLVLAKAATFGRIKWEKPTGRRRVRRTTLVVRRSSAPQTISKRRQKGPLSSNRRARDDDGGGVRRMAIADYAAVTMKRTAGRARVGKAALHRLYSRRFLWASHASRA